MQIKTILNRVHPIKSFVYGRVRWSADGQEIEVELRPRAKCRPICSKCGESGPGYDTLPTRRFAFVPLWGLVVWLLYAPRRVDCPHCGVRVEAMPWADGKRPITLAYAWFLAAWAKRMSWKEVALAFNTSWESVFRSVEMAVEWGRAHADLSGIQSIGIDEIAWKKGHRYLTLVYQIDTGMKRLLWIGEHRKEETLLKFFHWFGEARSAELRYVCSDMWKPYLQVIAKMAANAIHVLDRFHIMGHMSKAIDEVRAQEVKELKTKGLKPVLTNTRWLLLKRPKNLTEKQEVRLKDLLQYNLRSVRSYLLKEDFQGFWTCETPLGAAVYLHRWCKRTMYSKIEPMKRVARMLRTHRELLLNWFRAKGQLSSGSVEGLNTKAKLTFRKAFGFRTYRALEIALYHTLGDLPEPELAHRFC